MQGLFDVFGFGLTVAAVLLGAASVAAVVVAVRAHLEGRGWLAPACRALTAGAVGVVLAGTALPWTWPPTLESGGDLVLELGRGGLKYALETLADPTSLPAVLLVGNVLMFIPVGLCARLGWPASRTWTILAAGVALSCFVETVQFLALGRVASTDDVLLNTAGTLLGIGVAQLVRRPRGYHS